MSAASNYTEKNVINAILRGQAFPIPAGVYVALHTSDPGETGANEVQTAAWPSYARQDSTKGEDTLANSWEEPGDDGKSSNLKQLLFPVQDGASNVMVTHFSLWDAQTGGNCLNAAALDQSRTIQVGDVFVVDVGKLTVTQS